MNDQQTTGQAVIEHPAAAALFGDHGINFFLTRHQTLKETFAAAGAPLEQVLLELNHSAPFSKPVQVPDWEKETMKSIIHYIIHLHHVDTRSLLHRIEGGIARSITREHGHSEMQAVQKIFLEFSIKLEAHMREEEKEIFPFLIYAEVELKKGAELSKVLPLGQVFADSIRDVLFEHRFMDRGFLEMEKLMFLFQKSASIRIWSPSIRP